MNWIDKLKESINNWSNKYVSDIHNWDVLDIYYGILNVFNLYLKPS